MNTKSFLVSGIVAGAVNFLLGWVFYEQLFPDLYPDKGGEPNMLFIALGCLVFGFLVAYVFTGIASIKSTSEGIKAGAIFGLLNGLAMNLFMYSSMEPNYQNMAIDTAITIVMVAIMGAVIAMVNAKME